MAGNAKRTAGRLRKYRRANHKWRTAGKLGAAKAGIDQVQRAAAGHPSAAPVTAYRVSAAERWQAFVRGDPDPDLEDVRRAPPLDDGTTLTLREEAALRALRLELELRAMERKVQAMPLCAQDGGNPRNVIRQGVLDYKTPAGAKVTKIWLACGHIAYTPSYQEHVVARADGWPCYDCTNGLKADLNAADNPKTA